MSAKRQKSESTVEPGTETEDREPDEVKCPLSLFFNVTSDADGRNTSSTLPVEVLLPFLKPADVYTLSRVCQAAYETVYHFTEDNKLLKITNLKITNRMIDEVVFDHYNPNHWHLSETEGRSKGLRLVLDWIYLEGLTQLDVFDFDKSELFVLLDALKSMSSLQHLRLENYSLKVDETDFTALMQSLMCCENLSELCIAIESIPFTELTTQRWSNLTKTLSQSLRCVGLCSVELEGSIDEKDAAQIFASLENLECIAFAVEPGCIRDQEKRKSVVSSICLNVPTENLVRTGNEWRLWNHYVWHPWESESIYFFSNDYFFKKIPTLDEIETDHIFALNVL